MHTSLRRIVLAILTLAAALTGTPARATWYSENIENGADIIMMDLRWPWWPSGTYFANWNTSFNPKPNNITFYAGFLGTLPDGPGATPNPDEKLQDAFRPGSVWTFWGADKDGTPVRFTDVAPNLYIKNTYGGEGSSGTVGGTPWPFIQQKRWYTMLGRVWKVDDTHGYVARWIKDHADGKWHHIGTARLPIPATSFTGNAGFIEPLSNEKAVRSLHRRFGYFRKDGAWRKSDTIAIDKTQYVVVNVVPESDHEYVGIEYAQTPGLLPQRLTGAPISGDKKHAFTTKQPDLPTLDKPAVANVRAESTGSQVAVTWEIPETASPAFGYRVEVFDNPKCEGQPLAVKEERNPTARLALVDAKSATPTVRLTVTDIFDQAAPPVIQQSHEGELLRPYQRPSAGLPGLRYTLFQKEKKERMNHFYDPLIAPNEEHYWMGWGDILKGRLLKQGIARGFDLSVKESLNAGYAIGFSGSLRVPSDGLYVFRAQIDGAYRIKLMSNDLLIWDSQHGTTEKSAVRRLAKGDYSIEVLHVVDQLPSQNFRIEWEGPGISRRPIPLDALFCDDSRKVPQSNIVCTTDGDGTGRVSVKTEPISEVDRSTQKTVLYLGQLQLAESIGEDLKFHGPLPRGENTFWARVTYDGNHTIDSEHVTLNVTGNPVDPAWTARNVGDAKAQFGLYQTGANAFRFFGNGMHTITRKVTGDFTATVRIDDYNGARGEPVNRRAWVGLTAREHGDKLDWNWGRDFHLVQTAREGLRASADFTDFGAGRITSYELPKGRPWLRIVREGNIWTAWTSTDGKAWELGAYQFKKTNAQLDAGLFFSALPQEARAHYHATVSEFSIVDSVAKDCVVPFPPVAQNTGGDRLTGVVAARSDANVVVVRSTSGLLRTTDGGKTWSPANGTLKGAVRSVAIHPADPATMLRADAAGLWKTTDGGKAWTRIAFDGDFDATGPSALCGEVVAFDLRDPQILYAGTESRGFFKSTDSGATWKQLGLAGERITAVNVWAWERYYPAPAKGKTHLCVTTCPDRWMSLLGRGEPGTKTTATASRAYLSPDGVQTLAISDERRDTGFFNVAFDKALQSVNEMRYATAHGYQTQVFAGSHMALYPAQKNLESLRPFTAIAATAMGDQKFGRVITQALDPEVPGRLSRSERWAFEWHWLPIKGDVPKGGLIAVAGDVTLGERWWFIYTDGLYTSDDGGTTLRKIADHTGRAR
ncbi:MAG: hypothetical protein RL088_2113 [Verrucomicrobiota bacterium]|jgi:hypothetical protein